MISLIKQKINASGYDDLTIGKFWLKTLFELFTAGGAGAGQRWRSSLPSRSALFNSLA
jgi:hypothetical protein